MKTKYNCIFLILGQSTFTPMILKKLTNQTLIKKRKLIYTCDNRNIKAQGGKYFNAGHNNTIMNYLFEVL